MSDSQKKQLGLRRRPVTAADADFIRALYATTRAEEMDLVPWPPAQKEAFVRQQNEAQLQHYQTHFPQARHEIILLADKKRAPIGRIYTDYGPQELRLLDITLAPAYRNRGIGSQLMNELLAAAQAQSLPIRFHVFQPNVAAQRFYLRLGFTLLTDDGAYLQMGWDPPEGTGAP